MSIKPVDFQVMIPRTMEVSKASNDISQKNQTMQQQQAASTQQHAENTLKQVYSQNRSENARISEKQKENNDNKNDRKKKGKTGSAENKSLKKAMQTSTIDIKI